MTNRDAGTWLDEALAMAGQPRYPVLELDLSDPDLTGDHILTAVRAARSGRRTRITENGVPVAMIMPSAPQPGPDMLTALARGDDFGQLRAAAMAQAAELYGPDAELRVESAGEVRTSLAGGGRFCCNITVRCMNFPQEAL